MYRLIVSEKARDPYGNVLEILGSYNPHSKDLQVKADRVKYWVEKGAGLSSTVNNLLIEKKIITGEKVKTAKISKKRQVKLEKKKTDKVKAEEDAKAKAEAAANAAKEAKLAAEAAAKEAAEAPVAESAPEAPAEVANTEEKAE
jgi:small subunit ribosomal protein S16